MDEVMDEVSEGVKGGDKVESSGVVKLNGEMNGACDESMEVAETPTESPLDGAAAANSADDESAPEETVAEAATEEEPAADAVSASPNNNEELDSKEEQMDVDSEVEEVPNKECDTSSSEVPQTNNDASGDNLEESLGNGPCAESSSTVNSEVDEKKLDDGCDDSEQEEEKEQKDEDEVAANQTDEIGENSTEPSGSGGDSDKAIVNDTSETKEDSDQNDVGNSESDKISETDMSRTLQNGDAATSDGSEVEDPKSSDEKVEKLEEESTPEKKEGSDAKEEESAETEDTTPTKKGKGKKTPAPVTLTPRRSSRNLNKQKSYVEDKDDLPEKDDESDIEEITMVDPLAVPGDLTRENKENSKLRNSRGPNKTIVVNDTKHLVEIASGSKSTKGVKKEPTLVIIDTNSILSGRGPIPAQQQHTLHKPPPPRSHLQITPTHSPSVQQSYSVLPVSSHSQPSHSSPHIQAVVHSSLPGHSNQPGHSSQSSHSIQAAHSNPVSTQRLTTTSTITPVQKPPIILPSLTDDMYVVEAPSFIVPYVYEKPPVRSLKDYLETLQENIKAAKEAEAKAAADKKEESKKDEMKDDSAEKSDKVENDIKGIENQIKKEDDAKEKGSEDKEKGSEDKEKGSEDKEKESEIKDKESEIKDKDEEKEKEENEDKAKEAEVKVKDKEGEKEDVEESEKEKKAKEDEGTDKEKEGAEVSESKDKESDKEEVDKEKGDEDVEAKVDGKKEDKEKINDTKEKDDDKEKEDGEEKEDVKEKKDEEEEEGDKKEKDGDDKEKEDINDEKVTKKSPTEDEKMEVEEAEKDKVEDVKKDKEEDVEKDKVEDVEKDKVEDVEKDKVEDVEKDTKGKDDKNEIKEDKMDIDKAEKKEDKDSTKGSETKEKKETVENKVEEETAKDLKVHPSEKDDIKIDNEKDLSKGDESKKSTSYFDNPLGKFFMQIGINLVQEHVQTDLLRSQKKKRDREGGKGGANTQMAISSLEQTLEFSKENNEPFHLKQKKCDFCNFKTESALVMAHHMETPHMRNYLYRCNFCPLEVRSPHDILFHMEAEHNVRGRLERGPAFHQCPSCSFEDNQKGKLTRHLVSCQKRYRPEKNQEPPLDWEPPAKIPRVSRNRPNFPMAGTAVPGIGVPKTPPMVGQPHPLLPKLAAGPTLLGQATMSPVGTMGRGRGRPPMQSRFVPDMKQAQVIQQQVTRPMSAQPLRQGMLYRSSPAGPQSQVLLPTSYHIGNQIYQRPVVLQVVGGQLVGGMPMAMPSQGGLVPNVAASSFQNAASKVQASKAQQQPSISITPLPRQPSGAPPNAHSASMSGIKPGHPGSGGKATFVICEICDGYIKDLEQLRSHMQWIHKVKIHPKMIFNRPPLNCQKCQFRFFTDQGLERHLLGSHGLVTSSMQEAANKGKDGGRCPVCGRVYQWKLLNHVARDHSMTLKPAHLSYKCTVCTATFGMYKQFENHVYTAHSVVAKRVMEKKPGVGTSGSGSGAGGSSSSQGAVGRPVSTQRPAAASPQGDSLLKPLKINDEITIIPQPARGRPGLAGRPSPSPAHVQTKGGSEERPSSTRTSDGAEVIDLEGASGKDALSAVQERLRRRTSLEVSQVEPEQPQSQPQSQAEQPKAEQEQEQPPNKRSRRD